MIKLCKDCKFFEEERFGNGICHKQDRTFVNLVSGKVNTKPSDAWRDNANIQRGDGWLLSLTMNACGKAGRFWEKK